MRLISNMRVAEDRANTTENAGRPKTRACTEAALSACGFWTESLVAIRIA
jgi:hypothetical protein